jgi:hypothetical protein
MSGEGWRDGHGDYAIDGEYQEDQGQAGYISHIFNLQPVSESGYNLRTGQMNYKKS